MSSTETTSGQPQAPKNVNPFLKGIMIVAVFVAMIFHEPAKFLRKRVYERSGFLSFLGVVASLGAGIACGYLLGWSFELPIIKWLPGGVLASILTWYYLWPLTYLILFDKAIDFSETLWKLVPSPDSRKERTAWFSRFLVGLGYVASAVGAAALGWSTMLNVHEYLQWGWFGYVPGVVVGGIAGLIVGAFAIGAVNFLNLFAITVASGAGILFLASPWIREVVTAYGMANPEPYINGAYVLGMVLWAAYIFPLAHLLIGNVFRFVADFFDHLEELLTSVYEEKKGGYREFAMQITAIGAAVVIGYLSLSAWALVGVGYSVTIVLAALVGFAAYLILGSLLNSVGAVAVGLASSAGVAYFSFLLWGEAGLWFGLVGQCVAAILGAIFTYYLAFPLLYFLVRLVAKPLLASWLRDPLVKMHSALTEEIGHAFSRTYTDKTDYRDLFLHGVNIKATAALAFGAYLLSGGLGFGIYMTIGTVALVTGLSYMLVGKLLLKAGNYLVGVMTGLAVGVYAGAVVYATQSHGLVVAIPAGLVVAAAVFGVGFPLAYVVVRAFANLIAATRWLKPVLEGIYNFFWNFFASLWREFVETYKSVYNSLKPMFGNFRQTWEDTWESVRQSFSKWK